MNAQQIVNFVCSAVQVEKVVKVPDEQGFTMKLTERMSGRDNNLTYKIEPWGWLYRIFGRRSSFECFAWGR